MELLGIFARQAAIAIHLGQQVEQLNLALVNGIRDILDPTSKGLSSQLQQILDELENQPAQSQQSLVELVKIISTLSSQGEAEKLTCLKILAAVHELIESKPGLDWSSTSSLFEFDDR